MQVMQPDDIKKLTGSKTKQKAIECLTANQIRFVIGADGWPRVLVDWLSASKAPRNLPAEEPRLDQV